MRLRRPGDQEVVVEDASLNAPGVYAHVEDVLADVQPLVRKVLGDAASLLKNIGPRG